MQTLPFGACRDGTEFTSRCGAALGGGVVEAGRVGGDVWDASPRQPVPGFSSVLPPLGLALAAQRAPCRVNGLKFNP